MTASNTDRLILLNVVPGRIVSIALDGSDEFVLVGHTGGAPDGIAIDPQRGHIYWTNMGNEHQGEKFLLNDGSIQRVDLDGGNRTTIIPEGRTFTPKQMTLDVIQGLIYWADREGMRIMRSNLDGSDITVLVETGWTEEHRDDARNHCVGIAIDPIHHLLYWTQKGAPNAGEGRIMRAALDLPMGMSPRTRNDICTLFHDLPEPIDLEWHDETGYLYWTDRGDPPSGNTLNRAHIVGTSVGPREIVMGGLAEGIGLALDRPGRQAFVSDLTGYVRTVALDQPDSGHVIYSDKGPLTGIAMLAGT